MVILQCTSFHVKSKKEDNSTTIITFGNTAWLLIIPILIQKEHIEEDTNLYGFALSNKEITTLDNWGDQNIYKQKKHPFIFKKIGFGDDDTDGNDKKKDNDDKNVAQEL